MKRIPDVAVAVLVALGVGCATFSTVPVLPERSLDRSYALGAENETTAGSPMLRIGHIYSMPVYSPVDSLRPPGTSAMFADDRADLKPGQRWLGEVTITGKPGVVVVNRHHFFGKHYGIHILPDGTIGEGWVELPTRSKAGRGSWPPGVHFRKVDRVATEGSFEAELLYSGLSGSTIRLAYREYVDGLARPAFTQELTYDLSESKVITFKSLEIEVLEAGNSRIKFRVLSDGDLPWLPN